MTYFLLVLLLQDCPAAVDNKSRDNKFCDIKNSRTLAKRFTRLHKAKLTCFVVTIVDSFLKNGVKQHIFRNMWMIVWERSFSASVWAMVKRVVVCSLRACTIICTKYCLWIGFQYLSACHAIWALIQKWLGSCILWEFTMFVFRYGLLHTSHYLSINVSNGKWMALSGCCFFYFWQHLPIEHFFASMNEK